MKPDEHLHIVILAAVWALLPVIISAVLVVVSWQGASGRLKRNKTSGFRTPTTMRSDQAWIAAHRAALRLTPLFVIMTVAIWGVLLETVWHGSSVTGIIVVGLGSAAVIVAVVLFAAYVAGRAAKSVDDHHDGWPQ